MGLFGKKDAIVFTALEESRDVNGKPDPYKAVGMAMGASMASGKGWTFNDMIKLGAALGAAGAFDEEENK